MPSFLELKDSRLNVLSVFLFAGPSEVELPSHFTHDAVRAGNSVFLADTGGGHVFELALPAGPMLVAPKPLNYLKLA
jgi:hypothetical protein